MKIVIGETITRLLAVMETQSVISCNHMELIEGMQKRIIVLENHITSLDERIKAISTRT